MKKMFIVLFFVLTSFNVLGQVNAGPVITFNPAGGELTTLTPTITSYISDSDGVNYNSAKIKLNGLELPNTLYQIDPKAHSITIQLNEVYKLSLDSNIIDLEIQDNLGNIGIGSVGFDLNKALNYALVTINDSTASLNRSQCVILEGGFLKCFGYNYNGQLGTGTNQIIGDNETPAQMSPVNIPEKVDQVATGNRHTCAVTENGNLYCFGNNSFGQIGVGSILGDSGSDFYLPTLIDIGNKVKKVSAGYAHTCVILINGNLKCFGWNGYNVLGQPTNGNIGDNETPSSLPEISFGENVIQVTTGWQFTCVLVESGRVKCFGNNQLGQLGLGTQSFNMKNALQTPFLNFPKKVIEIASSYVHTCAILEDFSVYCFGKNQLGQLGLGHTMNIGDDEEASFGGPLPFDYPVIKVALGGTHSCALLSNEAIKCWGENNFNQLGYGHTYNLGDNEPISSYGYVNVGGGVVDVSLGDYVSYARLTDGRFKAWGENAFGELGFGICKSYFVTQTPSELPDVSLGGNIASTQTTTYIKLTAYFEVNQYFGPSPFLLTFDASKSFSGLSKITNYHLDFGNGESVDSTNPIINYTYLKNGVYKAILTVTDQYQFQTRFERTITVGPTNNPPLAFLKYLSTDLVVGDEGVFDASESFDVNGQIMNYQFNFGDGSILDSNLNQAKHAYSNAGNFLASVKVTDNDYSSAESLPVIVNVRPLNMAPFANLNCEIKHKLVSCDGFKSADLDGTIVKYQLKVGGLVFDSTNPGPFVFRFKKFGVYPLEFRVWDNLGLSTVSEMNLDIFPKAEQNNEKYEEVFDDKESHEFGLKNFEYLKWLIKKPNGEWFDLRNFNKKVASEAKIFAAVYDKKGNFFYVNQSGELWKKGIDGQKSIIMKQLVLPIAITIDGLDSKLYLYQNRDKSIVKFDLLRSSKTSFNYNSNCKLQRECDFNVELLSFDEDQNLVLINFEDQKLTEVQFSDSKYQKIILNEAEKLKIIFQLEF